LLELQPNLLASQLLHFEVPARLSSREVIEPKPSSQYHSALPVNFLVTDNRGSCRHGIVLDQGGFEEKRSPLKSGGTPLTRGLPVP
jgi:hypothetical protein